MKLVRTNIWIYLDAPELMEQISEYIQMSKSLQNKYPNMFVGPRVGQANIWINSDGGKLGKIVQIGQELPYGKISHEMATNKYPNKLWYPRFFQTNIENYLKSDKIYQTNICLHILINKTPLSES